MKNKGNSTVNWEDDLWKSLHEQDVMQLRIKLNDIHIQTENEVQSYNMNSVKDFESYGVSRSL